MSNQNISHRHCHPKLALGRLRLIYLLPEIDPTKHVTEERNKNMMQLSTVRCEVYGVRGDGMTML